MCTYLEHIAGLLFTPNYGREATLDIRPLSRGPEGGLISGVHCALQIIVLSLNASAGEYVCEIETFGAPVDQISTLEILGELTLEGRRKNYFSPSHSS